MKYRNVKTGAEIDAKCVISGGDWAPVPEPKKQKGKKSGEDKTESTED